MANPTPPGSTASGWTVTGQVDTTDFDMTGRAVRGWRVSFVTNAGVSGSVFVPKSIYTVENVRAAIAADVQTLNAVQGLSG